MVDAEFQNNKEINNILIEGLGKTYNSLNNRFTALADVNLSIKPGEVFGLLGPNGAGKSTFFNIATMNETRSEGSVDILGNSIESSYSDT